MKTVSYELSKKLVKTAEKHGVVLPHSLASWSMYFEIDDEPTLRESNGIKNGKDIDPWWSKDSRNEWFASFTADELMDWLPVTIEDESMVCFDRKFDLDVMKITHDGKIVYAVSYITHGILRGSPDHFKYKRLKTFYNTTNVLADALAQMAIWLIENGYVKNKESVK